MKQRLNDDSESAYLKWIPAYLEGYLYDGFVFQQSMNKYKESIDIAEQNTYNGQPLSGVYNSIAIKYYEEGYFPESIEYFEKAYSLWPESIIILNNRAFIYYIVDDSKAYDALLSCYEKTKEVNEMAGYNLASFILSKSKEKLDGNVIRLLSESFYKFIEEYKKQDSKKNILEAFSCVVLENIAHTQLKQVNKSREPKSLKDLEKRGANNLLTNLFGDIENFVSTTYSINKELNIFLQEEKTITNETIFTVLKRWSSYTPLIPRQNSTFKGGGHFFTWLGKGIIVDPGPSFLESFLQCGYRLADINAIICSHGHIDHTQDIERIITLLYEKNDKLEKKQKIKLILSPGNASKYGGLLSASTDVIESAIVLYPNKNIYIADLKIEIEPILANHFEIFARADTALCFAINLINENERYTLGFTNDTGLYGDANDNILDFFQKKSLDLFITNIGSISFARLQNLSGISIDEDWFNDLNSNLDLETIFKDDVLLESLGYKSYDDLNSTFFKGSKNKKYDWYKTHLGFRGVFHLAFLCNYKYMIISEFGEELKNYRHLIAKSINQTLELDNKILTGDIGTKFLLTEGKVKPFCQVQDKFVENNITERVVKNEDFRIIQISKQVLETPALKLKLENMFGVTLS